MDDLKVPMHFTLEEIRQEKLQKQDHMIRTVFTSKHYESFQRIMNMINIKLFNKNKSNRSLPRNTRVNTIKSEKVVSVNSDKPANPFATLLGTNSNNSGSIKMTA